MNTKYPPQIYIDRRKDPKMTRRTHSAQVTHIPCDWRMASRSYLEIGQKNPRSSSKNPKKDSPRMSVESAFPSPTA